MSTWKYFSYEGDKMLACPCCGEKGMSPVFMNAMDQLREEAGFPFIITSGYRCPSYNARISTTGDDGPHVLGRAVDVKVNSRNRFLLVRAAIFMGFTRIGIGPSFVHIDDCDKLGKDPCVIWNY